MLFSQILLGLGVVLVLISTAMGISTVYLRPELRFLKRFALILLFLFLGLVCLIIGSMRLLQAFPAS